MGKLTLLTKISGIQTVRISKETKQKKAVKLWDNQIKQLIGAKKHHIRSV